MRLWFGAPPLFALLTLLVSACGGGASANEATITIHFSSFQPDVTSVYAGEPVTFTLRNDDPLDHEWIVGTEEVHNRHRTGTDATHDTFPNEVTVPAFSTRITTLTFDEPGEYQYICHLPGHEAYGMVGTLRVVER